MADTVLLAGVVVAGVSTMSLLVFSMFRPLDDAPEKFFIFVSAMSVLGLGMIIYGVVNADVVDLGASEVTSSVSELIDAGDEVERPTTLAPEDITVYKD